MEDQELRLSGLAVSSTLANACQPLADVNKAKIQVNKITLIRLTNWPEAVCPLQGLVEHAQNAGYSAVVTFWDLDSCSQCFDSKTQLQDELLIPVLCTYDGECAYSVTGQSVDNAVALLAADRTNIEIAIMQPAEDLQKTRQYLRKLYYWFLLGPVITLEWLRRRKKQAEGGHVPGEATV